VDNDAAAFIKVCYILDAWGSLTSAFLQETAPAYYQPSGQAEICVSAPSPLFSNLTTCRPKGLRYVYLRINLLIITWIASSSPLYEFLKKSNYQNSTIAFEAQVILSSLLISQGRAEKDAYLSVLQTGTSHVFSE